MFIIFVLSIGTLFVHSNDPQVLTSCYLNDTLLVACTLNQTPFYERDIWQLDYMFQQFFFFLESKLLN